jgi:beta-1,2-mannobiose phosphorylase / 1,2-beta-oligomannan phosphorylase
VICLKDWTGQSGIRVRKGSTSSMKVGGGSQPIRTDRGWFLLYHGVEMQETVGVYRAFWALLDLDDPSRILHLEDGQPILEANAKLTRSIAHQLYLPTPIVFTTGVADAGDHYIVASGEADLACRITHMPKTMFT